jgi:RNA polymerase sigma-70 factor (ECF subfamily)
VLTPAGGSARNEEKREEKEMCVFEVQPDVNTARGLPPTSGNEELHNEHWLVAKAKSGQEDAFGELYKRHQLKVYHTAVRILRNQEDAEDAVQRAFQRALVNLERFRGDSSFLTWLTRIAINEALMLLRQRRTREPLNENSVDAEQEGGGVHIADAGPSPEEILCESERRATLIDAISQLRENLKVVVFHRELQGLTSVETAQLLGLTVSAVKARTFHARRVLRKHLERKFVGASLLVKLLQKTKA